MIVDVEEPVVVLMVMRVAVAMSIAVTMAVIMRVPATVLVAVVVTYAFLPHALRLGHPSMKVHT